MHQTQIPPPKYRDVTTRTVTCLSAGFLFLIIGTEPQNYLLIGIGSLFLLVAFFLVAFLLASRYWHRAPSIIARVDDATGASLFPVALMSATTGLFGIVKKYPNSNLPLILGLLFVVFIILLCAATLLSSRWTVADSAMQLKGLALAAGVLVIISLCCGAISIEASIYVLASGLILLSAGLILDYWVK